MEEWKDPERRTLFTDGRALRAIDGLTTPPPACTPDGSVSQGVLTANVMGAAALSFIIAFAFMAFRYVKNKRGRGSNPEPSPVIAMPVDGPLPTYKDQGRDGPCLLAVPESSRCSFSTI